MKQELVEAKLKAIKEADEKREILSNQIAELAKERYKLSREIDILRFSLRRAGVELPKSKRERG